MEKELKITQLKAKFTKDFDTFGKMDPFLVISIGKSQGRTETAHDAGKQPNWTTSISLNYIDQTALIFKAYDEDVTENQFMGQATLDLKSFKQSGNLQIKIQNKGQSIGVLFCKYVLTTLPPTPILFVKNIRCEFFTETKLLLKAKPYFSVSCGDQNMVSEVKQDGDGKSIQWSQNLRIKMKDGDKLWFNVLDKDDNGEKIFGYEAFASEFKTLNGHKKFCVNNKKNQPLGFLQFDYETSNFTNKEESNKNQQKMKEEENQLTKITVDKIRGELLKDGIDVYFKIICGPNMTKTKTIPSAKKNFVFDQKLSFYAEYKENALIFALWDENNISDDVVGVGNISLPTTAGQKKVDLKDKAGNAAGSIYVTLSTEKVVCKSVLIHDIKIKMDFSSDIIGQSEPFVVTRIGGWSCRTETGEGNEYTFKKNLQVKFSTEQKVIFEVWDEDVTSNDQLFEFEWNLKDLKEKKGQTFFKLKSVEGQVKGQLFFRYQAKNVKIQTVPIKNQKKKQSEKEIKKEIKQQVKKEQKQEQKKEQKKVQENKDQEKKEQKKDEEKKGEKKQAQKKEQTKKKTEQSPNKNSGLDKSNINVLEKSKHTVKLPALENNYGDRIFDKQSATTLQKSIHSYSMPKAERFSNAPKYAGEPSYYVDTCFGKSSQKGTALGYGNKRQFPDWMERNMKQNPAPGAYFEQRISATDTFRAKGPTFGISHKYYEKVIIPLQKKMISPVKKLNPIKNEFTKK